jgi:hypothetical protein
MTLLRHSRGLWARQEGAAATEFALLTVVLVPTMFYAIYFYELSVAKMKAQEASRYLVWELAAAGLSDWKDGHHQDKFDALQKELLQEVQDRWGDDQQSATPTLFPTAPDAKPMTLEVSIPQDQVDLQSVDAEVWDASVANGVSTGALGKGVDWLFRQMNFNTKGKLVGSLKFHIKNKLTGKALLLGYYKEKKFLADELDLSVKQSLIADQWDLKDGSDVVANGQQNDCGKFDYCYQVNRMQLLGIGSELNSVMSVADTILSVVGFHDPLRGVVASKALSDPSVPVDSSHNLQVADPPDHSSLRKHYTNVFRDNFTNNTSPYQKVYQRLGKYYLGCPQPQKFERKGTGSAGADECAY